MTNALVSPGAGRRARREETGAGVRIIRICSHAKKKGRAIADVALAALEAGLVVETGKACLPRGL